MNKMNELFNELWWFNDQAEPMNDFVEAIKEFTRYMKGSVSIALIDLYNYGFGDGCLYIAFHDDSGDPNPTMFNAGDFVEYYKEIMNYDPEAHFDGFWTPKLEEILEKYR